MFLSIHAITGVALAQSTTNPAIAFTLGLVSHYVLDAIPHGDEFLEEWHKNGKKKKVMSVLAIDFFVMFVSMMFLFSNQTFLHPNVIAWGVLGAVVPDFVQAIHIKTGKYFNRICSFHVFNHNSIGRLILPKIKSSQYLSAKAGFIVQGLFLLFILRWM